MADPDVVNRIVQMLLQTNPKFAETLLANQMNKPGWSPVDSAEGMPTRPNPWRAPMLDASIALQGLIGNPPSPNQYTERGFSALRDINPVTK